MKFNLYNFIFFVSCYTLNCFSLTNLQLKVGKNNGEINSYTDNVQLVFNYPDVEIAKEVITELVIQCFKDNKLFYQVNKSRSIGAQDFNITEKLIPDFNGVYGVDQKVSNQQIWLNLRNPTVPWNLAGKYLCNGTVTEAQSDMRIINPWNSNTVDLKYVPYKPVEVHDDINFHLNVGKDNGQNTSFTIGDEIDIILRFPRETTKGRSVMSIDAGCFKDGVKFYQYNDVETKFTPINGVNKVDQDMSGQIHLIIRNSTSNKNTAGLYECNGKVTEDFDDGEYVATRDWSSEKVELKFLSK